MKKNFCLFFITLILTLTLVEVFLSQFFYKKQFKYNHNNRFLLYEEGNIFRNIDKKFFTYHPHKKIETSLYYFNQDFVKVYNYSIITNNYGLVQNNDLEEKIPSILFLGDSFTEGQGNGSWLNNFDGKFESYQIINGGILGTGPQQFLLLEDYLSKKIDIDYVFVLYLGDDFRRSTYYHGEKELLCLKNYKLCKGSETFLGFPLLKKNPNFFLSQMRQNRFKDTTKISFKLIRRAVKTWLKDLYVIKIPLSYLKNNFYQSKNKKINSNFLAIEKLINKYQEKIYFVNLKQKQEIFYNKDSYETLYAKNFILNKTKNHFECDFEKNLEYFHTFDSHPNNRGYEYLYTCINNILKKVEIH
tara:strand:- start:217 stop:1290 length:1074 start_codon:yes stop_codon:yes gene_type:complete